MSIQAALAPSPFLTSVVGVDQHFFLHVTAEDRTSSQTYNYDLDIDEDLVLTSMEVTKTISSLTAANAAPDATNQESIVVRAFRVPPGTNAQVTLTTADEIARTVLSAIAADPASTPFLVGRKSIAGLLSVLGSTISSGNDVGTAEAAAPRFVAQTHHFGSSGGTSLDPLVRVSANTAVTNSQTKQRIRLRVEITKRADENVSGSCMIKLTLTPFSKFFNNGPGTFFMSPTIV